MPDSACVCVYAHRAVLRTGLVRHKKGTEDLFACWCLLHDHWLPVCRPQSGALPEHQDDCQTAEDEPARQYADPNERARQWSRPRVLVGHVMIRPESLRMGFVVLWIVSQRLSDVS